MCLFFKKNYFYIGLSSYKSFFLKTFEFIKTLLESDVHNYRIDVVVLPHHIDKGP